MILRFKVAIIIAVTIFSSACTENMENSRSGQALATDAATSFSRQFINSIEHGNFSKAVDMFSQVVIESYGGRMQYQSILHGYFTQLGEIKFGNIIRNEKRDLDGNNIKEYLITYQIEAHGQNFYFTVDLFFNIHAEAFSVYSFYFTELDNSMILPNKMLSK